MDEEPSLVHSHFMTKTNGFPRNTSTTDRAQHMSLKFGSARSLVREAEARLGQQASLEAKELIRAAYAALRQAEEAPTRVKQSTMVLAARMAAGLAVRELARETSPNRAA